MLTKSTRSRKDTFYILQKHIRVGKRVQTGYTTQSLCMQFQHIQIRVDVASEDTNKENE